MPIQLTARTNQLLAFYRNNKKVIQKRGVVPPSSIMYLAANKDKCSKCKSSQNKSKSKLSTRKKQKSSHRGAHKNNHSRAHIASLDHTHTISKYLNKFSLLENMAEKNKSFDQYDANYNIINQHNDSRGSLNGNDLYIWL